MIPPCFHQRRSLLTAWLQGRSMLDGMFVFFSSSLSPRRRLLLHQPFLSLLCTLFLKMIFRLISFHLFIFLYALLISSHPSFFPSFFASLFCCLCVVASALCPAVEGCRLAPSSVSDKVGLQAAACPTRGPSPPGLVTPSSALLLPQSQCRTQDGLSQLADQR